MVLIFAEKTFRQDRAENRKEINRRDKEREICRASASPIVIEPPRCS